MGYITALCVLAATFHLCLGDALCPPSNIIAPCQCDGEGMNCMNIKSDWEMQKVFGAIPRPWKCRAVWIQFTDVTTIPSGIFQGIEVQAFHIEVNKIRTIEEGAFRGSEQSLLIFSMFGNELEDADWSEAKKFPNLQSFNLGRNKLTSVPDNALSGLEHLSQVLLPENRISYIGPNAFNGLPSLSRLDLLHNRITVLGPFALAMDSHFPLLMINLANCSITSVAPTAFNGMQPYQLILAYNNLQYLDESAFSPLLNRMATAEGLLALEGNPLTCIGCSYSWIVDNKDTLKGPMVDFTCTDGRDLAALTLDNIQCPAQQ